MEKPTLHGLVTTFREDGSPLAEATYEQGVPHGPYRDYWSNGRLSLEGHYVHGAQDGEWRFYNPDGSLDIPADLAAQLDAAQPQGNFISLKVVPSAILNPRRALKVRPNHFAQYWNGVDGMPLHEAMWRYVTATREFVAPWGGHYGCTWILVLVACADIPDKPWNPPQTWRPATQLDEE